MASREKELLSEKVKKKKKAWRGVSVEERLASCMRALIVAGEGQEKGSIVRAALLLLPIPQGALVTLLDTHTFTHTHMLPYSWISLLPKARGERN